MSQSTTNVNDLFKTAHHEGTLSAKSLQAFNILDPGAQIQAGLGVDVDDVQASEVVLVTMMPDDSGSMQANRQLAKDGHNEVLRALKASKQSDGILALTRYLNGTVLYPYCALKQAVEMDDQNYNPNLGTPLYDQSIVLLGTVLAKAQEFSDNGVPVRTVTLIISDGADVHSIKAKAHDVKNIVDDMHRAETHIIAAMGIDDGHTDFRKVFSEMGIRDEWILTPKNNEKDIRKAFQLFSQSAVRASQGAASFSKTNLGGFGA